MRYTAAQLAQLQATVYQKFDTIGIEHQESRERLTRLEEKASVYHQQNGINGGRK